MTNCFKWRSVFTNTSIFTIHVECIACTLYTMLQKIMVEPTMTDSTINLKNVVSIRHPNIFIFFELLQMYNMSIKTVLTYIIYTECITIIEYIQM